MPGNFFTSDAFFAVLADVFFPGARTEIVECAGVQVRALVANGRPVHNFWPFPFPLEPLKSAAGAARRVPFLTHVLAGERPAGAPRASREGASPFVRWGEFENWRAFEAFAGRGGYASPSAMARKERLLSRDVAAVTFTAQDDDPQLFELMLRWKTEQYARTGMNITFTSGRTRRLYEVMRERGLLTATSLRAGGRIVAGQLSNRWDGQFLYRLPSYDPAFAKYSPGAVHLLHSLRLSYESGDTEFNFLMGAEPYKFQYATHVRLLKTLGREPARERWPRLARMQASRTLTSHPTAYRRLKIAEERVSLLARRLRL